MNRMAMLGAVLLTASSALAPALGQAVAPLSYVQPLTPAATRDIQDRLRQLGAYSGNVDGIWGRDSQLALQRFQRTHGLQATGQLNQATAATLGINPVDLLALGQPPGVAPPPPPAPALSPEVVRNIQSRLRALGFYPGQIDGLWGPGMQSALERFQQGRGLQATGQLNPA